MNIVQAIRDPNLFRPYLADKDGSISTWARWMCCLRAIHGLPLRKKWQKRLVKQCTGRNADRLPRAGADVSLILTGRRSGKSKIAAVVGAYEASLSGKEKSLSKGEMGMVAVISPTRLQSQIVKKYLRSIYDTPLLSQEIIQEDKEGFQLRNNVRIQILTGSFRAVRGFTLLAAVVDEAAFFGVDEESKVKSDHELITSIMPALATCKGRLLAITTPYARRGWCWNTYKRAHGNDKASILVWNCPSRTMNPLLPQKIIDEAMQEDRVAALSEFMGEFRDDISLLVPIEVVQACVVPNRKELLPRSGVQYVAFCDLSGGRGDDAGLVLAHKDADTKKIVVDCLRQYRPPFDPSAVIDKMAQILTNYRIRMVVGDRYAGNFVSEGFRSCGIAYKPAERSKSEYYIDMLSRLCSRQIELLDDSVSIQQIGSLERRTRSGGKDVCDHPSGGHDDLANCIAGVCDIVNRPQKKAGSWFNDSGGWGSNPRDRLLRELISKNAKVSIVE